MDDMTAVSLGLFAAWAAHDVEEWLTMSENSAGVLGRVSKILPLPHDLAQRGISQRHVNLSLATMAGIIATVSASGVRSRGRSPFFRGGVLAFGIHGITHMGASMLARGYTTGVVTAPIIVIPYWLWTSRKLRDNGIPLLGKGVVRSALLSVPLLVATHLVAATLLGAESIGE